VADNVWAFVDFPVSAGGDKEGNRKRRR